MFNSDGAGLGNYAVKFGTVFKQDHCRLTSDLQIFGELIASVQIPVNVNNFYYLVGFVTVY